MSVNSPGDFFFPEVDGWCGGGMACEVAMCSLRLRLAVMVIRKLSREGEKKEEKPTGIGMHLI